MKQKFKLQSLGVLDGEARLKPVSISAVILSARQKALARRAARTARGMEENLKSDLPPKLFSHSNKSNKEQKVRTKVL